jgi:putative ABC transport system permease protein
MGINVLDVHENCDASYCGAIDRMIIFTVVLEGLIIGIMSWFLAAVLSFPISFLLSGIISRAIFNSPIELVINIQGFVIWLGIVILLASLASILPARNAAHLTIREVLAYE